MPRVSLTGGQWTSIGRLVDEAVFENQLNDVLIISTDEGSVTKGGTRLEKGEKITIAPGNSVSVWVAYSQTMDYMYNFTTVPYFASDIDDLAVDEGDPISVDASAHVIGNSCTYSISVVDSQAAPAVGLSIDAETGVITGSFAAADTYTATVSVVNPALYAAAYEAGDPPTAVTNAFDIVVSGA